MNRICGFTPLRCTLKVLIRLTLILNLSNSPVVKLNLMFKTLLHCFQLLKHNRYQSILKKNKKTGPQIADARHTMHRCTDVTLFSYKVTSRL